MEIRSTGILLTYYIETELLNKFNDSRALHWDWSRRQSTLIKDKKNQFHQILLRVLYCKMRKSVAIHSISKNKIIRFLPNQNVLFIFEIVPREYFNHLLRWSMHNQVLLEYMVTMVVSDIFPITECWKDCKSNVHRALWLSYIGVIPNYEYFT